MDESKSNEMKILSNAERQAKFKANKLFKTLPIDVQHAIDRLSDNPEEKAQRNLIAIAMAYSSQYPHSVHKGIDYEAEALSPALPGSDDYHEHSGPDEHCWKCNKVLYRLEQPRQYSGTCLSCVCAA